MNYEVTEYNGKYWVTRCNPPYRFHYRIIRCNFKENAETICKILNADKDMNLCNFATAVDMQETYSEAYARGIVDGARIQREYEENFRVPKTEPFPIRDEVPFDHLCRQALYGAGGTQATDKVVIKINGSDASTGV